MVSPQLIQKTSRSRKLSRLRDYYEGRQDEGKPDFWTGQCGNGEVKPLRERRPCINYRFARAAVREVEKFTLGEGRFPRIKTESLQLSDFIAKLIESAQLKAIWSEALEDGLSVGTAVEIVSLRNGKFHSQSAMAEHCEPVFDDLGEVIQMTQCYTADVEVEVEGILRKEKMIYRRDIDATTDTVYELEPYNPSGKYDWIPASVVEHGLGFCPVNWGRNRRRPGDAHVDGISIFDGSQDELDALNLALSQRHRGINYWGTPQPWETGIEDDDKVGSTGRTAKESVHVGGWPFSKSRPARKTGVADTWRSNSKDAKFGLLEAAGTSFDSATKHVDDVSGRLAKEIGVVLPDIMAIIGKGDMSARLLMALYAPLLGLVDKIREGWWADFFKRSIIMRLRMVAVYGSGILVPGAGEFAIDPETELIPVWGPYFSPSVQETQASVKAAKDAVEAGFITKRTGAEYVSVDFGVQDVDAELAAVDEERDRAEEDRVDMQTDEQQTDGDAVPNAEPDAGADVTA